jgi:hypothetical protein
MKGPFAALAAIVLVVACSRDAPTGLGELGPTFAAAGSSGCYTVSGEIAQVGLFPSFTGTISGDIEGSVSTQLDPASVRATGAVRSNSGEQTWQVTGGKVPELIGRTVRLFLETEVVFAQPPIGRNNTRARVIEGAQAGNLTYHGTLNTTPPPPFAARVQYHGVICP